jgi:hypothetical protein
MLKYILILAFLQLAACSPEEQKELISPSPTTIAPGTVDPYLTTYFSSFIDKAALRGVYFDNYEDLSIVFTDELNENIIAQCEIILDSGLAASPEAVIQRSIYVNVNYWGTNDVAKEEFMDHEFSHCLLFRDHITQRQDFNFNGYNVNGPISLMYPTPISMNPNYGSDFFSFFRSYYLTELFDETKYNSIFTSANTVSKSIKVFANTTNGCIHADF